MARSPGRSRALHSPDGRRIGYALYGDERGSAGAELPRRARERPRCRPRRWGRPGAGPLSHLARPTRGRPHRPPARSWPAPVGARRSGTAPRAPRASRSSASWGGQKAVSTPWPSPSPSAVPGRALRRRRRRACRSMTAPHVKQLNRLDRTVDRPVRGTRPSPPGRTSPSRGCCLDVRPNTCCLRQAVQAPPGGRSQGGDRAWPLAPDAPRRRGGGPPREESTSTSP